MNNTAIINVFNNNSNSGHQKIQNQKIIATITNRFLKFKSMIKIPIMADNTFFTNIIFRNIKSYI